MTRMTGVLKKKKKRLEEATRLRRSGSTWAIRVLAGGASSLHWSHLWVCILTMSLGSYSSLTIPTDNGNLNGPPTLSHCWETNHTRTNYFSSLSWAANGFAAVCTLDICRRYVDLIHVQKLGLRFVCRIKVGFLYLICQSDQQTTSH